MGDFPTSNDVKLKFQNTDDLTEPFVNGLCIQHAGLTGYVLGVQLAVDRDVGDGSR